MMVSLSNPVIFTITGLFLSVHVKEKALSLLTRFVAAMLMSAFVGLTTSNIVSADEATDIQKDNETTVQSLSLNQNIEQVKQLLVAIDKLIANLTKVAEKAIDDADVATDANDRLRYEQLYAETSARLNELQTKRDRIAELLEELEAKLEDIQHAE